MFKSARLKLTAWYLLIIMCISIAFSVVIYQGLSKEVERFARIQELRNERRLRLRLSPDSVQQFNPPLPSALELDIDLVLETRQRILFALIAINATILIISGGLGYILAGKTLRPIKQMVDEQNRFIGDASHELRTPLTSLKTAMEVSLRDRSFSTQSARTLISESIDEVNKLQLLSEELLELAQFEKPNLHISLNAVLLHDVLQEAIKKIKPLAQNKKIIIKNKSTELTLNGNKSLLVDLFVILLDNAIKYSHQFYPITIATEKTDGTILVSVIDKGIGIAEKDIPHIFDRFYRADSARASKNSGGYGLGLAIAKQIIALHKGIISVKSTLGKGSVFLVQLPKKHRS